MVIDNAAASYVDIGSNAELHGALPLQAKDGWEPLKLMIRARIGVAHDACAELAAHDVRIRIGQVGGLVTLQVGDLSSFVAAASKRGIKGFARQTGEVVTGFATVFDPDGRRHHRPDVNGCGKRRILSATWPRGTQSRPTRF